MNTFPEDEVVIQSISDELSPTTSSAKLNLIWSNFERIVELAELSLGMVFYDFLNFLNIIKTSPKATWTFIGSIPSRISNLLQKAYHGIHPVLSLASLKMHNLIDQTRILVKRLYVEFKNWSSTQIEAISKKSSQVAQDLSSSSARLWKKMVTIFRRVSNFLIQLIKGTNTSVDANDGVIQEPQVVVTITPYVALSYQLEPKSPYLLYSNIHKASFEVNKTNESQVISSSTLESNEIASFKSKKVDNRPANN